MLTSLLAITLSGMPEGQVTATEVCVLPNQIVVTSPFLPYAPADLALARAGQALLTGWDGKGLALLEAPSCQVRPLTLEGSPEGFGAVFTVPGGRTLYQSSVGWHLVAPGEAPRQIMPPPAYPEARWPILSNDGKAIAWVVHDPSVPTTFIYGRGTLAVPRILLSPLDGGADTIIPLPPGTLANVSGLFLPRVLAVDPRQKEVTVAVETVESETSVYLAVGFDGAPRWGPITTKGIPPGLSDWANFRRVGTDWIAWGDATNIKDAPLAFAWSLAKKAGGHRVTVPLMPAQHPAIDSAAVSPDGAYVVVSVGLHTRMKLSQARTYVFRTRDGKVVFDQRFDSTAGSAVAFLGNDHFCYTAYDPVKQHHATHVVRLSSAAVPAK